MIKWYVFDWLVEVLIDWFDDGFDTLGGLAVGVKEWHLGDGLFLRMGIMW